MSRNRREGRRDSHCNRSPLRSQEGSATTDRASDPVSRDLCNATRDLPMADGVLRLHGRIYAGSGKPPRRNYGYYSAAMCNTRTNGPDRFIARCRCLLAANNSPGTKTGQPRYDQRRRRRPVADYLDTKGPRNTSLHTSLWEINRPGEYEGRESCIDTRLHVTVHVAH